MTTFFINLLTLGILLSSVFTISSKNPVISIIFLITSFVQAALYLILIKINFIGISYIVIYVGAIAILFLFVIMMINIKLSDILEIGIHYTKNLPLAIAIGSLFIFILFTLIPFNFNNILALSFFYDFYNKFMFLQFTVELFSPLICNFIFSQLFSYSDIFISDFQQIEVLGYGLYTYGGVLLIILSVILLLAMFATIVLSKSDYNYKFNSK